MKKQCWILIPKSCRSDDALADPLIKRLKEEDWCGLHIINLVPANYIESYNHCLEFFKRFKYDLVIVIGDRIEQSALAQCAFLNNQIIIHYGGGITNTIATYDDLIRHQISLIADIELCEDCYSAKKILDLWSLIGKINPHYISFYKHLEENNIHIVGNLYLEGIDIIDESLVPKEPYDLILYNPPTSLSFELQKEDIKELYEIQKSIKNLAIILDPNPDPKALFLPVTFPNLERPKFLGLLKNCKRFISNSSATVYEAPYYLKEEQIIRIGLRNKNRSTDFKNMEGNSVEKIVSIIRNWWENKRASR